MSWKELLEKILLSQTAEALRENLSILINPNINPYLAADLIKNLIESPIVLKESTVTIDIGSNISGLEIRTSNNHDVAYLSDDDEVFSVAYQEPGNHNLTLDFPPLKVKDFKNALLNEVASKRISQEFVGKLAIHVLARSLLVYLGTIDPAINNTRVRREANQLLKQYPNFREVAELLEVGMNPQILPTIRVAPPATYEQQMVMYHSNGMVICPWDATTGPWL